MSKCSNPKCNNGKIEVVVKRTLGAIFTEDIDCPRCKNTSIEPEVELISADSWATNIHYKGRSTAYVEDIQANARAHGEQEARREILGYADSYGETVKNGILDIIEEIEAAKAIEEDK